MNNRTVLILLGVAAVLILLASLGSLQKEPESAQAGRLFFPELESILGEANQVTILKAGNEPVATLRRTAEAWTVAERDGYPADFAKFRSGLLDLAEARVVEVKTSDPDQYGRLGVEDVSQDTATGVAVRIESSDDSTTVLVGEAEGEYRYLRQADQAESYLVDRNPDFGTETTDWLDTSLLDIGGERVRQVSVTHPDRETVLVRKTDVAQANFSVENMPEGRELLYDSVANVMGNVLERLRFDDVAKADEVEDAILVEFLTFDGLRVMAEASETDDQGWVHFTADHEPAEADLEAEPGESGPDAETEAAELNRRLSGWTFQIPRFKYEQMTRSIEDLLQSEPEPSP